MSVPPSFSAEQCRAKAAELLEAARLSLYLDQKRLYQEIAEQWLAIADDENRNGDQTGTAQSRTSEQACTGEQESADPVDWNQSLDDRALG